MRREYGKTVGEILRILEEIGPMTAMEISDHLNLNRYSTSSIIARLCKESKTIPKRAHIKSYTYDHEGQRKYPRAVYALGDKPNARNPGADPLGNSRRYRAKRKAKGTANFVFNLALPRRVYEKLDQL